MRGDVLEVVVRREHRHLMPDAKLREQRIARPDLNACAPAAAPDFRGVDVILPVGGEKRQGREPVDDVFACARSGESLQQLLQDQPRCHDQLAAFERLAQRTHLRDRRVVVAAQREQPDTGVDEERHRRERAAL